MQTINKTVQNYLKARFGSGGIRVRTTDTGFKFNKQELNSSDLDYLDNIPASVNVKIKRSGTGLVVIIN